MSRKGKAGILYGGLTGIVSGVFFAVLLGMYYGAEGILYGVAMGVFCGVLFGGLSYLFYRMQEKRYAGFGAELSKEYGVAFSGRAAFGADGRLLNGWLFLCGDRLVFRAIGADTADVTKVIRLSEIENTEETPFLWLFRTRFQVTLLSGETVKFRSAESADFVKGLKESGIKA